MGLDPEATPPSSERLIVRLLEKEAAARGPLAWEFFTILVAKTQAPWSVLDRSRLNPPLVFRLGERGELIHGMDATLDCAGLPVLADQDGVMASPWTCVPPSALHECPEPVFVCYLPKELFRTVEPRAHVGRAVWLTWAYKFVFERAYSYRAGAG
jgi:DNA/RNA-binding domain of Phe-tRNA-synthetase-like protein